MSGLHPATTNVLVCASRQMHTYMHISCRRQSCNCISVTQFGVCFLVTSWQQHEICSRHLIASIKQRQRLCRDGGGYVSATPLANKNKTIYFRTDVQASTFYFKSFNIQYFLHDYHDFYGCFWRVKWIELSFFYRFFSVVALKL